MAKKCLVNGNPISDDDFINAVQGYSMELYRKTMDQLTEKELKEVEELALEKLLARELIFEEALSQGIVASEENIEEETKKIIANFPSEEEFYATLQKAHIDPATYHRMIRQDLTVNLLTEKKLSEVPEPTEEQIKEIYERYPEKMKEPSQVRASHILIKVTEGKEDEAMGLAGSIKEEAVREDFAALAQKHSACPSAAQGGDLGFFKKGEMVKPFEDAAFALNIGEISDIVLTQFGYHLIKVTDRKEEIALSFEDAEPRIRKFLKDEAGAKYLKDWVEALKEKATIEVVE